MLNKSPKKSSHTIPYAPVLEYLPTFRTKLPSCVGFYTPAPWFAYGNDIDHSKYRYITNKHHSYWWFLYTPTMVRIWVLVGGFNPSEKFIPNIWKNKKCSKPPTRVRKSGSLHPRLSVAPPCGRCVKLYSCQLCQAASIVGKT